MQSKLPSSRIGVVLAVLIFTSFTLLRVSLNPHSDPESFPIGYGGVPAWGAYISESTNAGSFDAETQSDGSIHGSLLDESDAPVAGIEVDLMPAQKTGETRWNATQHAWADRLGEYIFRDVEPGEYFLAVHKNDAPDEVRPFMMAYYPGVGDETKADRVFVTTSARTELHPLRLTRVETVAISVHVIWNDGTPVERGNLLFHNLSYPDQAVIGDVAPQIDAGRGQITLPTGFEYHARAVVNCDSGTQIESRESTPVQQIKVEHGSIPRELTFVIPGTPCVLWSPHSK
jgi:hypothetical protein